MIKLSSLISEHMGPRSRPKARFYRPNSAFDFLSLIQSWEEIVGTRLAQHTIPVKNTRQNLTILTGHPAYAQQLSFMEEALKQKIFAHFPPLASQVQRLVFQTNPGHFERKKSQLLKAAAREPRTRPKRSHHPFDPRHKKLLAQAQETFSCINDREIKEKLVSLYAQCASKNPAPPTN